MFHTRIHLPSAEGAMLKLKFAELAKPDRRTMNRTVHINRVKKHTHTHTGPSQATSDSGMKDNLGTVVARIHSFAPPRALILAMTDTPFEVRLSSFIG